MIFVDGNKSCATGCQNILRAGDVAPTAPLLCPEIPTFTLQSYPPFFLFCFSACHFFYSTVTFHHFYQLGVDQHPPHASVREREGTVVQCSHIPWTIHHLENTSFREHIPRTTHPLKNTSLREHVRGRAHPLEQHIPWSCASLFPLFPRNSRPIALGGFAGRFDFPLPGVPFLAEAVCVP